MRDDIVLTDMRKCLPASAMAEQGRADTWRVMPYEAEPYSGWMLHAGEEERVPELRLPLPAEGRFNIYLSIAFSVRVRLDTDDVFRRFNAPGNHVEWFWKQAELSNNSPRASMRPQSESGMSCTESERWRRKFLSAAIADVLPLLFAPIKTVVSIDMSMRVAMRRRKFLISIKSMRMFPPYELAEAEDFPFLRLWCMNNSRSTEHHNIYGIQALTSTCLAILSVI